LEIRGTPGVGGARGETPPWVHYDKDQYAREVKRKRREKEGEKCGSLILKRHALKKEGGLGRPASKVQRAEVEAELTGRKK